MEINLNLYKGFIRTKGKQPLEKLKNTSKDNKNGNNTISYHTFDDIQQYDNGGWSLSVRRFLSQSQVPGGKQKMDL